MVNVTNGIRAALLATVLGSGLLLTACNDERPGRNRDHDRHDRHDRDHDHDRRGNRH